VIGALQWSSMIVAVTLRLLYPIFEQVLGLILLMGTSSTKDVEACRSSWPTGAYPRGWTWSGSSTGSGRTRYAASSSLSCSEPFGRRDR
jgi:hypothetical protein